MKASEAFTIFQDYLYYHVQFDDDHLEESVKRSDRTYENFKQFCKNHNIEWDM